MKVLLKPGWKAKVFMIKPRVCLLDNNNRQVVDKTFDEMYSLGHLEFTIEQALFSFPVFVV